MHGGNAFREKSANVTEELYTPGKKRVLKKKEGGCAGTMGPQQIWDWLGQSAWRAGKNRRGKKREQVVSKERRYGQTYRARESGEMETSCPSKKSKEGLCQMSGSGKTGGAKRSHVTRKKKRAEGTKGKKSKSNKKGKNSIGLKATQRGVRYMMEERKTTGGWLDVERGGRQANGRPAATGKIC